MLTIFILKLIKWYEIIYYCLTISYCFNYEGFLSFLVSLNNYVSFLYLSILYLYIYIFFYVFLY